jgi:hypothetical protein
MVQALLSLGDTSVGETMAMTAEETWNWRAHPLFSQLFHSREQNTPLPWDFVDCGISRDRLWNEYKKALAANRSEDTMRGEVEEVCQK